MGLPLLRGRPFDQEDAFGKPLVAIIDTNFANRFFPGQDPIGKQINDAGPTSSRQRSVDRGTNAPHTERQFQCL